MYIYTHLSLSLSLCIYIYTHTYTCPVAWQERAPSKQRAGLRPGEGARQVSLGLGGTRKRFG